MPPEKKLTTKTPREKGKKKRKINERVRAQGVIKEKVNNFINIL